MDTYIARVARAWEPYTTPDGEVLDPLDPADSGDNYGVILLADVMLREAARQSDQALAETGQHIVEKAAALPQISGPFNLLAIASLWRDGQAGRFPAATWAQIGGLVALLAEHITPPSEGSCFTTPGCYTNWRLVWSAGAGALAAGGILGKLGSASVVARDIRSDLALATSHAGTPASPSPLPGVRELSDPGSEPPAYHLFSSALLELIAEANPSAMTAGIQRLRQQAAHYALELMAPDGQLSYAGRSLDQSWVQAAAADLGSRQTILDPARANQWLSFADRAVSYLLSAYPPRPDGIVPIVPGLLADWSPAIMDGYAALSQYEGLMLWFLSDALDHWPSVSAPRASLPADASTYLVGDLHSSGLVWGRSGRVWWSLMGRTTAHDPRSTQGLASVKVQTSLGWRDLLALRPLHSAVSTAWTLTLAGGRTATPFFTSVRGDGHRAMLTGSWRLSSGHAVAPASWMIHTTRSGVALSITRPPRSQLKASTWLPEIGAHLLADGATLRHGACMVSASGYACPLTLRWGRGANASLELWP